MSYAAKRALEAARANQNVIAMNRAEFRVAVDPRPENRADVHKVMPTDIHSRLDDVQPAMHLHAYGKPIEKMTDRVWFDLAKGTTAHFEARPNIVDARQ